MCINAYLKNSLLKIIELQAIVNGCEDVWHDGRMLEKWADPCAVNKLELTELFRARDAS